MIRAASLGVALLLAGPAAAGRAHPDLTIGVASFPSTLHPAIDPDQIKFYILGFADRPVTAFDATGHLVCLLCTEIPSIANGAAKLEDLPRSSARVGREPTSGFANTHTWSIVSRVDVMDRQTAVLHYTEPTYQFDQLAELLPAHLEETAFEHAAAPPTTCCTACTIGRRPIPACTTAPIWSPATTPARAWCWSATRTDTAHNRRSIASSSRPSATPPRCRRTC